MNNSRSKGTLKWATDKQTKNLLVRSSPPASYRSEKPKFTPSKVNREKRLKLVAKFKQLTKKSTKVVQ